MNFIIDFDIELLRWIQNSRIAYLDNFLYWVSYSTTFVSIALLLVLASQGFIKKARNFKVIFYQLLTVFLTSAFVSLVLKFTIERPRPFITYPDIVKLSEAGSFSFPSGHTTEAFSMAFGAMLLFQNKLWSIPIILWALLVAYSRMALGVHYPFDVFAAILIALIISFLTIITRAKWIKIK
ncbi:phosphatase PAP2 family protein [Phaeodactylibacter luteus]|uniref:Phosphatase PAP2 family protein n=1 Tax=Phaeodactylibacter luteus TaxID=1564516 RepID=A0A5C6RFC9_9BACT|nr:phosphatase PAP2 family protein [Phaeodactylibacter luteus]TXB60110.1 phosphatase PAP2 family protein [Phaeodactylibacter luteus]